MTQIQDPDSLRENSRRRRSYCRQVYTALSRRVIETGGHRERRPHNETGDEPTEEEEDFFSSTQPLPYGRPGMLIYYFERNNTLCERLI